jgi:hypothetical protein
MQAPSKCDPPNWPQGVLLVSMPPEHRTGISMTHFCPRRPSRKSLSSAGDTVTAGQTLARLTLPEGGSVHGVEADPESNRDRAQFR